MLPPRWNCPGNSPVARSITVGTIVLVLLFSGCALVNPSKTEGLGAAAEWKSSAEALAQNADEVHRVRYVEARAAVQGWLADVAVRADAVKRNPFAQLDLSREDIPPAVLAKVDRYFAAILGKGTTVAAAAVVILDWMYDVAKQGREASADELKKRLKDLEWDSWETVRSRWPGSASKPSSS